MQRLLASLTLIAATAVPATAQNCRVDVRSGKCIFVPAGQQTPPDFAVGDSFPVYDHSMILNIDRYDLPPVDGAWRYYKSGPDIYKVETGTYRVLAILRHAGR
jgi:hypothetical protein